MMEVVTGYARDVIALIWHYMLSENDIRASLTPTERDARAGKHDFRLLAKLKALDVADPGEFRRTEPNAGADQWPEIGRIAIITDDVLSRHAVQFFAPFFHTPVRVFSNSQSWKARTWLQRR